MGRASFGRLFTRIFIASILALLAAFPAWAQSAGDIQARNRQVEQLYNQGKYAEAVKRAEQTFALAEKTLGREHPDTLTSVNNLGFLYQAQARYSEADPLYQRALAGYEKALGPEHPLTLTSVNNLGILYQAQGRYGEAEPLYKRALASTEKVLGPEHPDTLGNVNNLAALYYTQGRHGEAEPFYKRALAGYEKTLGPEHPLTLTSVNNLGLLDQAQGRYSQAEPLLKRALADREKALGPEHPDTLTSVNNLGFLYQAQARYSEADPLYQRALAGYEKALGPEHPLTLTNVNNLGILYQAQGRYGEAEPLFKRALASAETALGAAHPDTLRNANNLAALYRAQGRYGEAEPLFKRALTGYEQALGREHPDTLTSINNLAALYRAQDRYGEAEPLYRRALTGYEQALGREHPLTLTSVTNLAALYFVQRDWESAALLWRRSTAAIAKRTQRGALDAGLTGKTKSETEQFDWQFWGLVKAAYRLAPEGRAPGEASKMFETAQWALSSEAAESLAQMAVRGAKGDPMLAALVRERQDLVDEWQTREKTQAAALGQETVKRNAKAEADNRERMAAIDGRIADIDVELKDKFPDYAALASPAPLTIEDVQAQLRADEALVLFIDTPEAKPTPEETFIWVVTKTEMRWLRSDLGKAALAREVAALRCGLDYTAGGRVNCKELTGASYNAAHYPDKLPPFDSVRAHRLYQALLGGAEDLLKAKTHLLLVPSGALTQLPPHALVTESPTAGKPTEWLVRRRAISILPAVSSLKALRATTRPSAAEKPMIGFGNPLLDGPDSRYAKRAEEARRKQSCPKTAWERVAGLVDLDRGLTPIATRALAKPEDMLRVPPLPETADELCEVAHQSGADVGQMRLGARATEREVKGLSDGGELARYRVVHFATHGVMAGELKPGFEPGLILTPPAEASETDDGYLTASEIAGLKMDADWVILSACNTAAGQAASAEALSGLARAFIYAQARSLLVSHWEVDSDAAVKLVTTSTREITRDKKIGPAEALRRAMLAMVDSGNAKEAHPSIWAPFVVVGEGAR